MGILWNLFSKISLGFFSSVLKYSFYIIGKKILVFAPLFFVTFMIICTFIFLNLFIFVILSEFGKHSQEEENPTQLFKDNLIKFRKVWSRLTMISKGIKLPSKLLIDFFKMLEPPMGFGKECRRELVAREIMKMNLLG